MTFKVVDYLNPIVSMQLVKKPNCNFCTEERLTILKKLRDKKVTLINSFFRYMGHTVKNFFPSIFSKYQRSHYWVKVLDCTGDLNTLDLNSKMFILTTKDIILHIWNDLKTNQVQAHGFLYECMG